jgi:hypothetical protein
MQVLVKCVIFDGRPLTADPPRRRAARITSVRDGQVLGAWRAVDGRIGFALLDIASMAMVPALLNEAFPDARHIDVDEVVAVEAVAAASHVHQPPAGGTSRQTGS